MLSSILLFWAGLSLIMTILYTFILFLALNYKRAELNEKLAPMNGGEPVDITLARMLLSIVLIYFAWPFFIYTVATSNK